MSGASLTTVLRWLVIMVLFGYLSSRIFIAYSKLQEGRIGTLFNRITSATVKVDQKKGILTYCMINRTLLYIFSFFDALNL